MGAIALSSPFVSLTDSLVVPNQALNGIGLPLSPFKYTGGFIDFALDATGNPTVGSGTAWSSVPTDAIALEMWCNANGASDYLFWASRSGQMSTTGVLGTNISNNIGATNPTRFVINGARVVIPFQSVGTLGSALRFGGGTGTARAQGRYIAAGSGFPYLMANSAGAAIDFVIAGAGASAQVPFSDPTRFPTGYAGLYMQITGTGPVRATWDGTTPTATLGDIILPGTYLIDVAKHGISLSALRMFVPASTWVVGNALMYA